MPHLLSLTKKHNFHYIPVKLGWSTRNCNAIFGGKTLDWLKTYIVEEPGKGARLLTRKDIPLTWLWEEFPHLVVFNIPVLLPPIQHNCRFIPIKWGLPMTFYESMREIYEIRTHLIRHLAEGKDVFCCFLFSDRILHLFWVNDTVKRLLLEMDEVIRQALEYAKEWAISSDHGMKPYNLGAKSWIEERRDIAGMRNIRNRKADHSKDAFWLSNLPEKPNSLVQIYKILRKHVAK